MEEQLLFTRIHDALDVPMPPGAYERLRTNLTKKPVRPFRWPALQTRWSKMSFRLAAGLAIFAIVAAAAAAAVAIHNSTNSTSPAGSRMSISKYQHLISRDSAGLMAAGSQACVSASPACDTAASRLLQASQEWASDLQQTEPPLRFATIHSEMQGHLVQTVMSFTSLVADSRARDGAAVTRDVNAALYNGDWLQLMTSAIEESQEVGPADYSRVIAMNTNALNACGAPCGFGGQARDCTASSGLGCSDYFGQLAVSFGGYMAAVVKNAAPPLLTDQGVRIQKDLAQADTVLLKMNLTVTAGSQTDFNSEVAQLEQIKARIDQDAAKVTG